ncbi:hypothetical protein TNCV_1024851 [Trichonephila clavipes]|nr:hypothetical protein TNCV_1024851 [Trichonephila clavipes]
MTTTGRRLPTLSNRSQDFKFCVIGHEFDSRKKHGYLGMHSAIAARKSSREVGGKGRKGGRFLALQGVFWGGTELKKSYCRLLGAQTTANDRCPTSPLPRCISWALI